MSLEYAILAFLEYQPMTGYELKKLIDDSVSHFWSATQSHIYKALNGLEKRRWVESRQVAQTGRPNRKEYHLTETGHSELHRWLTTPVPLEKVREDWLIQVFFSMFSTNEQVAALFEARMKEIRQRVEVYRNEGQASLDSYAAQVGIERARQLWQMTLDYGVAYYEAQLDWLGKTLKKVRELPALTPPKPAIPAGNGPGEDAS
jgi:PadR family transcriptional regulator AphA